MLQRCLEYRASLAAVVEDLLGSRGQAPFKT
jgi:hypothetical protein